MPLRSLIRRAALSLPPLRRLYDHARTLAAERAELADRLADVEAALAAQQAHRAAERAAAERRLAEAQARVRELGEVQDRLYGLNSDLQRAVALNDRLRRRVQELEAGATGGGPA